MRNVLLCIGLLALAACGANDVTNPEREIAGVYNLKTIDGSPLPFLDVGGSDNFTIISDAITMNSDKSWSESASYQQTVNGQVVAGTITDGGSWVLVGNDLTMSSVGQPTSTYTGTYSKNTLTLNALGYVQVFVR